MIKYVLYLLWSLLVVVKSQSEVNKTECSSSKVFPIIEGSGQFYQHLNDIIAFTNRDMLFGGQSMSK